MAASPIREFLATLGFKVDTAGAQTFNQHLTSATLNARLLGDALEKMARSIGGAIKQATSDLTALYYASVRIGTSAQSIRAFQFAAEQMGSTVEEANSTLETFATKLRTEPGFAAYVQSLTHVRVEAGKTAEAVNNIFSFLNRQTMPVALSFLPGLGISEQQYTQQRMRQEESMRYQNEYNRKAREIGVDLTKATVDSVSLARSLNSMSASFGLIFDKMLSSMSGTLGEDFADIVKIIDRNGAAIADNLITIGHELAKIFKEFVAWLGSDQGRKDILEIIAGIQKIVEMLVALVKGVNWAVEAIGGWKVALTAFVAIWLVGWVARVLTVFRGLGLSAASIFGLATAGMGVALGAAIYEATQPGGLEGNISFGEWRRRHPKEPAGNYFLNPERGANPKDRVKAGRAAAGMFGGGSVDENTIMSTLSASQQDAAIAAMAKGEGRPGSLSTYNNPTNMMWGAYASSHGATGPGLGGVAMFPTKDIGYAAAKHMLFDSDSKLGKLSIHDAMYAHTPPSIPGNRPDLHVKRVLEALNAGDSAGALRHAERLRGVDPRLADILQRTAAHMQGGAYMEVTPHGGFRSGDPRQHGRGLAADVQIYGPDGKPVPNYQSGSNFSVYETMAQIARMEQQKNYPELSDSFRWGGYFSGPPGKYGALDLMHLDINKNTGMGGGSWEHGLTAAQRALFPSAESLGAARLHSPASGGGSTSSAAAAIDAANTTKPSRLNVVETPSVPAHLATDKAAANKAMIASVANKLGKAGFGKKEIDMAHTLFTLTLGGRDDIYKQMDAETKAKYVEMMSHMSYETSNKDRSFMRRPHKPLTSGPTPDLHVPVPGPKTSRSNTGGDTHIYASGFDDPDAAAAAIARRRNNRLYAGLIRNGQGAVSVA